MKKLKWVLRNMNESDIKIETVLYKQLIELFPSIIPNNFKMNYQINESVDKKMDKIKQITRMDNEQKTLIITALGKEIAQLAWIKQESRYMVLIIDINVKNELLNIMESESNHFKNDINLLQKLNYMNFINEFGTNFVVLELKKC